MSEGLVAVLALIALTLAPEVGPNADVRASPPPAEAQEPAASAAEALESQHPSGSAAVLRAGAPSTR